MSKSPGDKTTWTMHQTSSQYVAIQRATRTQRRRHIASHHSDGRECCHRQTIRVEKHRFNHSHLLHLVALALAVLVLALADPALATVVAPRTRTLVYAYSPVRGGHHRRHRLGAMYRHQVTCQIMLATERPATRLVVARIRLRAVRVVRLCVGLEVVRASERSGAQRARILLLGVTLHILHPSSSSGRARHRSVGANGGDRRDSGQLGRDVRRRYRVLSDTHSGRVVVLLVNLRLRVVVRRSRAANTDVLRLRRLIVREAATR